MTPQEASSVKAKLEELEQLVRTLRARLEQLERTLAPRADNPQDQTAVRKKVVYDWQA
jgi:hypothetical protein